MYCPECGNQNPDTAKFCIKCGYQYNQSLTAKAKVSQATVDEVLAALPAPKTSSPTFDVKRPSSPNTKTSAGATAAVAMLIGIAGIIGLLAYKEQQRQSSYAGSNNTTTTTTSSMSLQPSANTMNSAPSQQSLTYTSETSAGNKRLLPQAFSVGAGQYYYSKFTIPKKWTTADVVGNFSASGGDGNDVQVFITDESGLTNIKNGHSGMVWYDSGKVTVGEINVNLGPGTYYIVFSNAFSIFTNKAITADINVEYQY